MDIKKIQTFEIGDGAESQDLYLTLDLIPIHLVIKYDLIENKTALGSFFFPPKFIDKLFTKDVYQQIINLLCKKLELKERNLITYNSRLPLFNFKKDKQFLEYQFSGGFGREYYVETDIRHALRHHEQFDSIREYFMEETNDDSSMIYDQLKWVEDALKKQKVFTRRDYWTLSKASTDRFIDSLKTACK